ncbi:phage tail tape measure protein [Methylomonas sp. EFPC1]|uniref:phage tail tape measure protein n=1 Tax=Methylomonas sp. EFPC1 TaxID=2812647 RepID=UPI0019688BF4|nr:phage tail tape measure protein [Methylomonas sp. EFPC1]QSB03234.1 phage tail tape measure protein [Methylomonas sp. EFPC1]
MNNNLTLSLRIGAAFTSGFKATFSSATNEVKKLDTATKRYAKSIGDVYKAQAARNKAAGGASLGGLAGVVGAAYAFAQPIKQAIEFETAMLGVAKQVDGARDAGGKLTPVYTSMRKEIQMLGREIPIANNELAAMVEAGARMGVAKENLIGFTRTAAVMASAFDLPSAELADNMGKIANLYKIPIPAIGELGDTINYLDDKSIAKGGDIIGFLTRVGGVAASVKITGGNMAALGSTLLSLGENTETASTATNAIFQKFAAAESGTKSFREAMGSLGLSLSNVQKGMQVYLCCWWTVMAIFGAAG